MDLQNRSAFAPYARSTSPDTSFKAVFISRSGLEPPGKFEGPSRIPDEVYMRALVTQRRQTSMAPSMRSVDSSSAAASPYASSLRSFLSHSPSPRTPPDCPAVGKSKARAVSPRLAATLRKEDVELFVCELSGRVGVTNLLGLGVQPRALAKLVHFGAGALIHEVEQLDALRAFLRPVLADEIKTKLFSAVIASPYGPAAIRTISFFAGALGELNYKPTELLALAARQLDIRRSHDKLRCVARLHEWLTVALQLRIEPEPFFEMEAIDPSMLDALAHHQGNLLELKNPASPIAPFIAKVMCLGEGIKVQRLGLYGRPLYNLGLTQAQVFDLLYLDATGAHVEHMLNHLEKFYGRPAAIAEYLHLISRVERGNKDARVAKRKRTESHGAQESSGQTKRRAVEHACAKRCARSAFEDVEQRIATLTTVEQLRLGIPFDYILRRSGVKGAYPTRPYRAIHHKLEALLSCGMQIEDLCELVGYEGSEHIVYALSRFEAVCSGDKPASVPGVRGADFKSLKLSPRRVLHAVLQMLARAPGAAISSSATVLQHPAALSALLHFIALSEMTDKQFDEMFCGGDFCKTPPERMHKIVHGYADVYVRRDRYDLDDAKTISAGALELFSHIGDAGLTLYRRYVEPLLRLGVSIEDAHRAVLEHQPLGTLDRMLLANVAAERQQKERTGDAAQKSAQDVLAKWQTKGASIPATLSSLGLLPVIIDAYRLTSADIDALAAADDTLGAVALLTEFSEEIDDDRELKLDEVLQAACTNLGRQALRERYLCE